MKHLLMSQTYRVMMKVRVVYCGGLVNIELVSLTLLPYSGEQYFPLLVEQRDFSLVKEQISLLKAISHRVG